MKRSHEGRTPVIQAADSMTAVSDPDFGRPLCTSIRNENRYLNNTGYQIYLVYRSGQAVLIPPSINNDVSSNDVTIRQITQWTKEIIFDAARLFDDKAEDRPEIEKVLAKAFEYANLPRVNSPRFTMGDHMPRYSTIDFRIDADTLVKNEGGIYVPDLDLVIALAGPGLEAPIHPESHRGRLSRKVENDVMLKNNRGFVYKVEIVDNAGEFGHRFINIFNTIYRVDPVKDEEREDGVYVYHNVSTESHAKKGTIMQDIFGLDDAEKLTWMFRTVADAEALGDLKNMHERRLEEEKIAFKREELSRLQEIAQIRQDTDRAAARSAQQIAESKAALAREEAELALGKIKLQEERARLEFERERARIRDKEEFERRSEKRKEWMELLKWVPMILIGAGAVISVIVKHRGATTTTA